MLILGGMKEFHKNFGQLCTNPQCPPSRLLLYSPTTQTVDCNVDSAEISLILPYLFIGALSFMIVAFIYLSVDHSHDTSLSLLIVGYPNNTQLSDCKHQAVFC